MGTTTSAQQGPPSRHITTRRVAFDHADLGPDRHWFDDDLFSSHLVAALSAVIPPGERFVADAVKKRRPHLPVSMRSDINGFVGQETMHQREHTRFNEALAGLGYPTDLIERWSGLSFALMSRLPESLQVASTAAIEHWTAVIAENFLETDRLDEIQWSPSSRSFLTWHLYEELEHRALAFDAMRSEGTSELERMMAMQVVVGFLIGPVVGGLVLSLLSDRSLRRPTRLLRSMRRFQNSGLVRPRFVRDLLSWYRPGFHPDHRNIDDVMARLEEELFGETGRLVAG